MTTSPSELPETVRYATDRVRRGEEPIDVRLRLLFIECGVDVDTSLFDYWSEDTSLLEGFIVTSAGNVFTWDLDFLNRERMESAPELGTVSRWREVTDEPSAWYPEEHVTAVRAFVLAGHRLA